MSKILMRARFDHDQILMSKNLKSPRIDQDQNLDVEIFVASKKNPNLIILYIYIPK
jgi:cytochrome c